jgi:hypothetical protein
MGIKGTRFATMQDIKSNATAELRKILKETMAGSMEQVCVRKGATLKVIR